MSQLADSQRTQRQIWAAAGSRHDRLIGLLRLILPVAILALALLLTVTPFTTRDISFVLAKDRVELAHERMRVTAANYRGEDSKGQPFELNAASAVQASSNDPVVKLQTLSAKLQLDDGPAIVNAGHGRYDMDSEKVAIDGPVEMHSNDGYNMQTRDVGIDLQTRTFESHGAVDGKMPMGYFSGDHMSGDLNSRIVTLQGRARLHIDPRQAKAAQTSKASAKKASGVHKTSPIQPAHPGAKPGGAR